MLIRRGRHGGRAVGLGIVMAAMLSGCDYWPPALQTQIEQLRSELQTVTTEKAQLQTQMTSLMNIFTVLALFSALVLIANTMTTLVAEQRNEIGVMKAVDAASATIIANG